MWSGKGFHKGLWGWVWYGMVCPTVSGVAGGPLPHAPRVSGRGQGPACRDTRLLPSWLLGGGGVLLLRSPPARPPVLPPPVLARCGGGGRGLGALGGLWGRAWVIGYKKWVPGARGLGGDAHW